MNEDPAVVVKVWLVAIPERIPLDHMADCKGKPDGKGGFKAPTLGFSKLKFPGFPVIGYGKDEDGTDAEYTFPTNTVNNVNLFFKTA